MGRVSRGWAALLATGLFGTAVACGSDGTTGSGPDTLELPEVQLTGAEEVPPVQTSATGTATATMTGNLLRVTGSFQGLGSDLTEIAGSSAHVHEAPRGQSGPVVFPLQVTPGPDNRSGTFDGEMLLDESQLQAFADGRYYVNVHTVTNPQGEIRGQLEAAPQEEPPNQFELPGGTPEPNTDDAKSQPKDFPGLTPPPFPGLPPPA